MPSENESKIKSKVLVIEDDVNVRETLEEILQLNSYATISAENGLVGVTKIMENDPDLIICDVMMPKVNGFDVLKIITDKYKLINKTVPIFIFLTALSEIKDLKQGVTLGADDYILKPFSSKDLLTSIRAKLNHRYERNPRNFVNALYNLEKIDFNDSALAGEELDKVQFSKEELVNGLKVQRKIISDLTIIESDMSFYQKVKRLGQRIFRGARINIKIACPQIIKMDETIEYELITIINECVTNAIKHSKAKNIIIEVFEFNGNIFASIKDVGVGFDPEKINSGHGLKNINSRVYRLGGEIEVLSTTGNGITINFVIPKSFERFLDTIL